ncbi:hypothetical protein Tsubulata_028312, partial [Turnera subulata]
MEQPEDEVVIVEVEEEGGGVKGKGKGKAKGKVPVDAGSFKSGTYKLIKSKLSHHMSAERASSITGENIRNKIRALKDKTALKKEVSVRHCEEKLKSSYIGKLTEKYPSREYVCGRAFPQFPKLQRIFGRDRATGEYAETPADALQEMQQEEVADTTGDSAQAPTASMGTTGATLGGGAASSSAAPPDASMASGSQGSKKRKAQANDALWALTDAICCGFEKAGMHLGDIAAAIRGKDSPRALGEELRKMGITTLDVIQVLPFFMQSCLLVHMTIAY